MWRLYTVLAFLVAGCNKDDAWDMLKTRGTHVIEQRELPAFQAITVYGGINVVLKPDEKYAAVLDGWENLMPKIHLTVDGQGMLTVEDGNRFNFVRNRDNMTTVYLSFAGGLSNIRDFGDGYITTEDTLHTAGLYLLCEGASGSVDLKVNTPSIQIGINNHNVAPITIEGICDHMGIINWGYAPMDFVRLKVRSMDAVHRGTGDIHVNVSESISVTLYSLGNMYYTGNPQTTVTRNGKGNLYRLDR